MAQKRIILLLDGTWDDEDSGPIDTNIVRMQEIIDKSLNAGPASLQCPPTVGVASSARKLAAGRTFETGEVEHLVFYERGVGTGPFDYIGGGAFGEGVSGNIRRAYRFLSFYYEEGDQIFIFGFSRGAYTARSLVDDSHVEELIAHVVARAAFAEDPAKLSFSPSRDARPNLRSRPIRGNSAAAVRPGGA